MEKSHINKRGVKKEQKQKSKQKEKDDKVDKMRDDEFEE